MTQTYGLANNGATIGKVTGVLAPNNQMGAGTSAQNFAQKPPTPPQTATAPNTYVGMLQNHTLKSDAAGNTYSAPKSNPSVLAQQQALNKQGAGLVEDGIAGPKTSAAIAKYSSGGSTTPPAPVNTGDSYIGGSTGGSQVTPPATPQVGSTTQNAQNLLNTGNQTSQENQMQNNVINAGNLTPLEQQSRTAVTQAGQMSPEEQAANNNVAAANQQLKSYQNVQTLSPYAEAQNFQTNAPTPGQVQNLEQAPDLAGRASGTAGLLGSLGNIYGTANVAGANAALQGTQTAAARAQNAANTNLGAAQNTASRGLSADTTAYGGAQTQASRAQGTAGTVLGASIPGQISGSARTYNPLDPTGTQGTSGIIQGANNQSTYDLQSQYNQGKVALQAADGIQQQIVNTLQSNPTLNQTPISAITNLNQLLSGQTSDPAQQLLAQQIHQYITTLGLDPATVTNIASQKQGTLASLLDSLRQTAQAQNDAKNPANLNLGGSNNTSSTSGSSTGGNLFGSFF